MSVHFRYGQVCRTSLHHCFSIHPDAKRQCRTAMPPARCRRRRRCSMRTQVRFTQCSILSHIVRFLSIERKELASSSSWCLGRCPCLGRCKEAARAGRKITPITAVPARLDASAILASAVNFFFLSLRGKPGAALLLLACAECLDADDSLGTVFSTAPSPSHRRRRRPPTATTLVAQRPLLLCLPATPPRYAQHLLEASAE